MFFKIGVGVVGVMVVLLELIWRFNICIVNVFGFILGLVDWRWGICFFCIFCEDLVII